MDLDYCIRELEANAAAIEQLVRTVDHAQSSWKPSDLDWSILEVICHLRDEEREDFPFRIRHLFSGSKDKWTPILPTKWVLDRNYIADDLHKALDGYLSERSNNIDWLKSVSAADWDVKYTQEPLEGLSAGNLLAAWTVHDLLHIRQINELKYKFGADKALADQSLIYAGEWQELSDIS